MNAILRPVLALLISAAILLAGNGAMSVLVPIRAQLERFSQIDIGWVGSGYYAGLVVGCFICPRIIARVGHIRAFTAFTATATTVPLILVTIIDVWAWWALRLLNGICLAGLFMAIESWLAVTTSNETRGRVLSAYMVLNLTAVTLGMQCVGIFEPSGFQVFSVAAILYSLAAVPIALTLTPGPSVPRTTRLRLRRLIIVSPAAVVGCFFTGMANGAFWAMAPIFARGSGLSAGEAALLMSVMLFAGAAFQWPTGYLSDRAGRRKTLVVVSFVALAAAIGLYLASLPSFGVGKLAMFGIAVVYGGMAFAIYPISVSHANDLIARERVVEVSSGLLLIFSIGAAVGPVTASAFMSWVGPQALFAHAAIVHALTITWLLVRIGLRPTPPDTSRDEFVAVPRTTPAVFDLDPRVPSERDPEAVNCRVAT